MSSSDAAPLPRLGEVFFDVRGDSRSMRLSWYANTGVAVFSIWQGGTCTGTFRLPIADLPRMVEALQHGPHGRVRDTMGTEEPAGGDGRRHGPAVPRPPVADSDVETGQRSGAVHLPPPRGPGQDRSAVAGDWDFATEPPSGRHSGRHAEPGPAEADYPTGPAYPPAASGRDGQRLPPGPGYLDGSPARPYVPAHHAAGRELPDDDRDGQYGRPGGQHAAEPASESLPPYEPPPGGRGQRYNGGSPGRR